MAKYDFNHLIPRRGTNSVKWDEEPAADILPMWVADMDFRTAPCVVEALRRRVEHGVYGYATVPESYYGAVTSWFARRHGWAPGADWILPVTGVIPALSAILRALTRPGDRVLVLDNGVFGKGFADFVKIYGGQPTLYTADYREAIDPAALRSFLEKDHQFKYATVVHCDTPSGMLNPIEELCPLLKEYGILTVVDSVSAMFGNAVNVDESKIDILCGGSQKALSAAVGLTMLAVSDEAMAAMEARKTPIASFYANILTFKDYDKNQWFPYTPPINDLVGLAAAVDNVLADPDILGRHRRIAAACREALGQSGLSLYQRSGFSNTVTVFTVPEGVTAKEILDAMLRDYGIMIAGSFDCLAGQVIRIGHMGENANVKDMTETMTALGKALAKLGLPQAAGLGEAFTRSLAAAERF